jgi:hypothetical protein
LETTGGAAPALPDAGPGERVALLMRRIDMQAHRVTWIARRRRDGANEITHLGGSDWVLSAREVAARIRAGMDACGDIFIIEDAGETAIVQVERDQHDVPLLKTVVGGVPTDHLHRLPCRTMPLAEPVG